GIANIKVDDVPHDLLVLDIGLVLVADPDQSGTGRGRLTRLAESMPVSELTERHWFIRYDEMVHARVIKNVPVRAELALSDGRRLALVQQWTSPQLTKQSDQVLVRLLSTKPSGRPVPGPGVPGSGVPGPGVPGPGVPGAATTPGGNAGSEPTGRHRHGAPAD